MKEIRIVQGINEYILFSGQAITVYLSLESLLKDLERILKSNNQ